MINIYICDSQRHLTTKLLPKRAARILRSTLEELYQRLREEHISVTTNHVNSTVSTNCEPTNSLDRDFQRRRREQQTEHEIQEAFLRFMACVLKGYRAYLIPITRAPTVGTTDPQALFQLAAFLRSRDKAHQKFFQLLMRTQMFIRFIEERSFVSEHDQGLAFFDECTERANIEDSQDTRLIELDMAGNSERTVFVLPPECQTPGESYKYDSFVLDPTLLLHKKRNFKSHLNNINSLTPGSPMARRTKHEIKYAMRMAKHSQASPENWAKCLLGACYSMYFIVLPAAIDRNAGKEQSLLRSAYELLVRASKLKIQCDEVCYRVMMQLCGVHSVPVLAVRLLFLMKRSGLQPNALTYGFYNRCVLEAAWPLDSPSSSQLLWNRLKNAVLGAARFKRAGRRYAARRMSANADDISTSLLDIVDGASRTSLESGHSHTDLMTAQNLDYMAFDKLKNRCSTIVRSGNTPDALTSENVLSSAGLLMSANTEKPQRVNSASSPPPTPTANHFKGEKNPSKVFTRAESFASDAQIVDKLQRMQLGGGDTVNSKRILDFSEANSTEELDKTDDIKTSPTKTSPRTPVTSNDPLGALDRPPTPEPAPVLPENVVLTQNNNELLSDTPQLFKGQRSATFDESLHLGKSLHRSETVPANSVTSSLASLGNSLKLSFGRYSPARMSLRKSDLKLPQHIIENAITSIRLDRSLQLGKEQSLLRSAYELLVRASKLKIQCDEVCYRVMMQLCGVHSVPVLAVRLLFLMKRSGLQPNALTYGFYNRCVLEAAWPLDSPSSSQLLWNRLKNAVLGAARFKRAGRRYAARRMSANADDISTSLLDIVDGASRTSLESGHSHTDLMTAQNLDYTAFDKLKNRCSTIVRSGNTPDALTSENVLSSAGLLMSANTEKPQRVNSASSPPPTPTANHFKGEKNPSKVFTRAESFASDAQIVDKLQRMQLGGGDTVNSKRILDFSEANSTEELDKTDDIKTSPTKTSPRTPVTSNDPLGALDRPPTPEPAPVLPENVVLTQNNNELLSDTPQLFKGQRSATFDESLHLGKSLHRSETVPANSVTSSLASLGNSLKLSFGRYSPARMSLRKSDLKLPQHIIENAITSISPSLTSKKSNELIQGGISTIKSAASTVVKKLDEIKEAMSNNTTPVKVFDRDDGESCDGSTSGLEGETRVRRVSSEFDESRKGSTLNLWDCQPSQQYSHSYPILPDNLYPPINEISQEHADAEISLSSCSQCHNCMAILYDEEILAGWTPEDSNLNTTCNSCLKHTVPLLSININILRPSTRKSEVLSVPYLNPLVLRKELESILAREGDLCLSCEKFIEEHPIIYWNLLWIFERINVSSHLISLFVSNCFF
ncbi:C-myc promoter-binding protein-like [Ctenocephalides felis]|uniref:C-myc promoter-binding protein-like n=1 Tax=Ctenocephalides felis TaxID=7515 RepID=UPI000E6E4360|nr:C-myc promoter-binding protein-like [Ctenocephalides felis]